jgi:hypothetical protein
VHNQTSKTNVCKGDGKSNRNSKKEMMSKSPEMMAQQQGEAVKEIGEFLM